MKKLQLDTLNMYESTYDVLQKNNSVWSANVPFSAAVVAFKTFIDVIHAQHIIQSGKTKGITEDKNTIRKKLEDSGFTITKALVFLASSSNDTVLYKEVYKPRSEFTQTRNKDLYAFSLQIHGSAAAHASALLPLGITGTMINDFKTLAQTFATASGGPADAILTKKLATAAIKQAITDANEVLKNRLDSIMELFRTSHSKFYTTYKSARIIINTGRRRRALKISYFDSETGKPLKGVRSNLDGKKIRPSTAKGNNFVQYMDEGKHRLVASIDKYEEQSVDFTSVKGEMTKLVVKLRKK